MQTFLTILNNWTTTAKSVLIARIWCIARHCIKKLIEIRRIRPVSFCDKHGISALVIKPANCRYNKVNNHYFLNGNSNWKLLKLLTSCVRLFEYVSFQYQHLQMHSYPQFLQSTFYCRVCTSLSMEAFLESTCLLKKTKNKIGLKCMSSTD